MNHKDMINHLYEKGCGVCNSAAFEFEKYLGKYRLLKRENEILNAELNEYCAISTVDEFRALKRKSDCFPCGRKTQCNEPEDCELCLQCKEAETALAAKESEGSE